MNEIKRLVRIFMILAVCVLVVACPEPRNDAGGLGDEFEVALGFPRGLDAASRSTINDDGNVAKVYAKVYNSAREHLPSTDTTGVTALAFNGTKWTATVHLAAPASGTITFLVWAENTSGEHLYSGNDDLVVGTNGNAIIVPTAAGYSLRDMGPAGGYIFYDKGSYSSGWRFLEAAPSGWSNGSSDPYYLFGYYRTTSEGINQIVGTGTAIGTGKANTTALVNAMSATAYAAPLPSVSTTADYAARICDIHETNGYGDWFLPSKDELDLMYDNLKTQSLGGFSDAYYYSSSENTSDLAWAQLFSSGYQNDFGYRNVEQRVRPVRAF